MIQLMCTSFNFLIHESLATVKSDKKKKKRKKKTAIMLLSLEEKY